jgi:hypothetical protein
MLLYQPAARRIFHLHVPSAKVDHLGAEPAVHRVERSLPQCLAFCGRGQMLFPFSPWIQVLELAGEIGEPSRLTSEVLQGQ